MESSPLPDFAQIKNAARELAAAVSTMEYAHSLSITYPHSKKSLRYYEDSRTYALGLYSVLAGLMEPYLVYTDPDVPPGHLIRVGDLEIDASGLFAAPTLASAALDMNPADHPGAFDYAAPDD